MDWGADSQCQRAVHEDGEEGTIRELRNRWTGHKLVTHRASESRGYKDRSEDLRTRITAGPKLSGGGLYGVAVLW